MRAEVEITPYRDGPYLVRGEFVLRAQDGTAIDVSRRTVALCRCGKSRIRPFCDGTHRLVKFQAPSQAEDPRGDSLAGPKTDGSTPRDGSPQAPRDAGKQGGESNGHRPRVIQSPIAKAGTELRGAQASLGRLLQHPVSLAGYRALIAAEPLLRAASAVLAAPGPPSASARGQSPAGIAPCLCLVEGALTELSVLDATRDGEVWRLVGQVQSVVELLERG
jgi:CDGSH-type Zn-finger protein